MNLAELPRGATVDVEHLDAKLFDPAKRTFGKLPAGLEGVFLISSEHPMSEFLVRVDSVGHGERAAYRAEIESLGYKIVGEQPFAVRRAEPATFPRSAIPDHPDAVNQLLAIDRAISREQPTLADKPGRAETNLYELIPQLKKIDAELVLPFYDRLIDLYLDAGNEHYANRQAKLALKLLPKGKAEAWLVARVRALLERRFYSTLLVDAALAATAKNAALDLHLEIFEAVLRNTIKPYKGLLAAVTKRATAAKAKPRLDKLLLEHASDGFLLANPEHDELSAIFEAALEVVDAQPEADRVAHLQAIADRALGEEGEVVHRATAWKVLTERLDELPQLRDTVISLAFTICKNIRIGYEDDDNGIGADFRARVGQFLQTIPPEALARRFDDWAKVLDDYDDWARGWFYDTYLTLEELVPRHPGVFQHEGIAKAVTKGLLLGAVYGENHEEFVDKLQDFLDQTKASHVRVDELAKLAIDLVQRDRAAEVTPLFEKVALHARETLQDVIAAVVERAHAMGLAGEPILRMVAAHARWITAPTRARIAEVLGRTDPWERFVEAAVEGGATISAPEVWMDLAEARLSDWRSMLHDHREVGGVRYVAVGKPDYKGALTILVDGKKTLRIENAWGGETFQTARFRDADGGLRVQILFGEDEEEWKVRTCDLDGEHAVEVTLGTWERCLFPRHMPWIVALSEERVAILDLDGNLLAEHELAMKYIGDAEDFWKTVHPLRDHLALAGTRQTLVLGRDPHVATYLERKVDGSLYRGGKLLFECRTGKTSELVDVDGRSVEALPIYVTGSMCGQCDEIHSSEYHPTNLRGTDGEIVAREDKKFHLIQSVDNRPLGRVLIDFDSEYYIDVKCADLDGDGIDEIWYVDYKGGRLMRVFDPAASTRTAIAGKQRALRETSRAPLHLARGTSADDVARYLATTIDASAAREALASPVFDAARKAVAAHHALIEQIYATLDGTAESWPVATVSKRIRLPASELARLKTTYFERPIDDYPLARALETGTLEGYDKLWVRKENPAGPDQSYLRHLIWAHLTIARETGLHADIRSRALDLVELLVDRAQQPDVQLFVSADEAGDGYFSLEEGEASDLFAAKALTEPVEKALAKLEKAWKVSGFTWTVGGERSIYDGTIRGTQKLGAATLDLWFGFDPDETLVHQDEPELYGPIPDVIAAVPTLAKLTKWDVAHQGVPAKVWPDGAHAWAPLDEWMLPEELDGYRREVAMLRAAGPKETTIGRAAHGEVLAKMAAQYGIPEDTAAVLAAMILTRRFDRATIAKWAKVKPDSLLKHFKALIALGLVKTVEREYGLDVPLVAPNYGTPTEPAFQRVFWSAARNQREAPSRDLLRFPEADVLAAFLAHVAGKAAKAEPKKGKAPAKKAPAKKPAKRAKK